MTQGEPAGIPKQKKRHKQARRVVALTRGWLRNTVCVPEQLASPLMCRAVPPPGPCFAMLCRAVPTPALCRAVPCRPPVLCRAVSRPVELIRAAPLSWAMAASWDADFGCIGADLIFSSQRALCAHMVSCGYPAVMSSAARGVQPELWVPLCS